MMPRSIIGPSVLAAAGALVWLAFGPPNPAGSTGLLSSSDPTHAQVVAGMGLLAWSAVAVVCAALVIRVLGRAGPNRLSMAVLVVGLGLLATGIALHVHRGPDICCGSIQAAQRAVGDAP